MGLPILHKNLDEPPQGVCLHDIEGAPAEVGRDQIALGVFAFIFQRHDEPFGVMGTYLQTATAHDRYHLVPATDADSQWRTGMRGTRVGDVLFTLVQPHLLMAA